MQLREMCCLAVLCSVFCTASTAYAGSFDEWGKFTPEGDFVIGFGDESGDTLSVFELGRVPSGLEPSELVENRQDALEGGDVLSIGGVERVRVYRALSNAEGSFEGRRVVFSLWYKSAGTNVNASIVWVPGDREAFLSQPSADQEVGELILHPTGRVTSDGWVELSSGEVDFYLGSKIPASFLKLHDGRFIYGLEAQDTHHDPEDRVLIDAFEVRDVGEAAVPDASCTAPTEDVACGEHGTCLFGKCVDAASIWSAPPVESQRAGYSKRLAATTMHHQGGRAFRDDTAPMGGRLLEATSSSARDYWYTYLDTLEQSGDGHATPIFQTRPWKAIGGGGACLGPGVGDLLPGADEELTMMVFRLKEGVDNLVTQQLQPGDVLASIDGLPWRDWIKTVPYYVLQFSHNPDVELHKASRAMLAAVTTGATVTFKRCSKEDGIACSEQEVEEIVLDLSELHGPQLWNDEPLQGHFLGYWCDWRFSPSLAYPDASSAAGNLFLTDLIDGVRHILFNGFPGWDPQWPSKLNSAFVQAPERGFLLDMRWGEGGRLDLSGDFLRRFLDENNPAEFHYYPWFGAFDIYAMWTLVDSCSNWFWCVGVFSERPHSDGNETRFNTQPVAMLVGHDGSGSEVAWLALLQREGPVRTFGYAASLGLFGYVCPRARMWGEYRAQLGHCSDMQIIDGQGQRSEFLAGTFLEPDERLYQKQSDAVAGVDTVVARAQEWLEEQSMMQGEQP